MSEVTELPPPADPVAVAELPPKDIDSVAVARLYGDVTTARIRNLTFENLTLGGKPVRDSALFKTNEFVDGLQFLPATNFKP